MIQTTPWDGHAISKPGLYGALGLEAYHAANICNGPSISSSGLRAIFNQSPAHFFAEWRGNPNRVERGDSRHFIIGRAVHHLLLGEPFFAKLFAIQPEEYEGAKGEMKPWSNNATDCKKWHAERRKEGRSVLTLEEIENIRGMAEQLGAHPIIRAGALNGLIERSVFWKDQSGMWLKSRPDSIPGDSGDFVDLKTTTSVRWGDLVRTIGDCGYHQQGALVRRAAREVLGIEHPTFTLVFVEKKNPWCVRVVTLKESDLDRGDKQNRIATDQFAACLKAGRWPGPGADREDAEYIELSDRQQKVIDDQITILSA
jgi:PDDEXK-like domain of unknown function (DUF3799)